MSIDVFRLRCPALHDDAAAVSCAFLVLDCILVSSCYTSHHLTSPVFRMRRSALNDYQVMYDYDDDDSLRDKLRFSI